MAKSVKHRIEFKDPDFSSVLQDLGMSQEGAEKVNKRSLFNEYFVFQITFDADSGQVLGCRQVKAE